jgi:hypothetical protein
MPTEAMHRTSEVQEKAPSMATQLTKEDIHSSETEAVPHLPHPVHEQERVQTMPTIIEHADVHSDATVADVPRPAGQQKSKRLEEQHGTVPPAQKHIEPPLKEVQLQSEHTILTYPPARTSSRGRPIWMMLIGSVLTLILVAGAAAAYIYSRSGNNPNGTALSLHASATATATYTKNSKNANPATQQTSGDISKLPGPPAGIQGVGSRLYGTTKPGKDCDTQGGQWSNSSNAKLTCNQSTLDLTNTGPDQPAATFLNQLSGNQAIPDAYIIQADVSSQSQFGVFFHSKPGAQPAGYAFIIDPVQNIWTLYYYDPTQGGKQIRLATTPLQTKIQGTVTMDVAVSATNHFTLYINGVSQTQNANGTYDSAGGSIGLLTGSGASATFKNLSLYTYNGY